MLNQTTATKSKPGRGQHLVAHRLLAVLLLLLTLWGQSAFAGVNALYGHYTTKPGRGVQIDTSHPLVQGVRSLLIFNEGGGLPFDLARKTPIDSLISAPVWSANLAGISGLATATNQYWQIGPQSLLPTGRATVAVIRQKTDTTLRTSSLFGHGGASNGDRCNAQVPYSDGIVYWEFGGNTSPNRLTWSGYSVSTNVEQWVFVAGTRGSAIYLNGVQVASQTTAITRTNTDGSTFALNQLAGFGLAGDLQHFNLAMVLDAEWTPAQAAWWSADPYAFLLQSNVRRWGIPVTAGGGGSGGLLLRGVGQ